jgi:hypothetical protein
MIKRCAGAVDMAVPSRFLPKAMRQRVIVHLTVPIKDSEFRTRLCGPSWAPLASSDWGSRKEEHVTCRHCLALIEKYDKHFNQAFEVGGADACAQ